MANGRTGALVLAVLAAALAFTAVFAQEGAEQEKESLPNSGAAKPGEFIIKGRIPYPPPARPKPAYVFIHHDTDNEALRLYIVPESGVEFQDGQLRSAGGAAKGEEAAREVMGVLKRYGVERLTERRMAWGLRTYWADVKGLTKEKRLECMNELRKCQAVLKVEVPSLLDGLPRKTEQLSWAKVIYDDGTRKYTDVIQVKFREGSKVRLRERKLATLSESEKEREEMREVNAALHGHGAGRVRHLEESVESILRYQKEGHIPERPQPDVRLWVDVDVQALSLKERVSLFRALAESPLIEAMDFELIEIDKKDRGSIGRPARIYCLGENRKRKLERLRPYKAGAKRYYFEFPSGPLEDTRAIGVKFMQPSKVRLREGKFVSLYHNEAEEIKLAPVNALLERFTITQIKRSSSLPEEEQELQDKERERSLGEKGTDTNLLYNLNVEHLAAEERLMFVNELNALDIVGSAAFPSRSFLLGDNLMMGPLIGGLLLCERS